jgi:hypothetical protein
MSRFLLVMRCALLPIVSGTVAFLPFVTARAPGARRIATIRPIAD